MKTPVTVIDYGMGNLRSVCKALEISGAKVSLTDKPGDVAKAGALVLPGVGAFYRAMENLSKLDLVSPIKDSIQAGKPFLGICLGLQLLFTESFEHGRSKGLGVLKGKVKRFSRGLKVPHMGWNTLEINRKNARIFIGIPNESYFYFVHSYYVEPHDKTYVSSVTPYGKKFASSLACGNVFGVQFHPEKSSESGLKILRNFVEIVLDR